MITRPRVETLRRRGIATLAQSMFPNDFRNSIVYAERKSKTLRHKSLGRVSNIAAISCATCYPSENMRNHQWKVWKWGSSFFCLTDPHSSVEGPQVSDRILRIIIQRYEENPWIS